MVVAWPDRHKIFKTGRRSCDASLLMFGDVSAAQAGGEWKTSCGVLCAVCGVDRGALQRSLGFGAQERVKQPDQMDDMLSLKLST